MENSRSASDNLRQHPRAQFFRLRLDEGFVPVFAFAPPDDEAAIPAILMDISEGGLQVICDADNFVASRLYDCALMDRPLPAQQPTNSWIIERVWSREEGIYLKSGFSFTVQGGVTPEVMAQMATAEHHLMRCVLHPLQRID